MLKLTSKRIAILTSLNLCIVLFALGITATAQENNTTKVELEENLSMTSPVEQQEKSEVPKEEKIKSPHKQMAAGVAASDVICKEELELIIKASDGSAACVKPTSVSILIERGWAKQSI